MVNVARSQNNVGEILSDQGKLEEAEALFVEAQRVWRAANYPVGIALATSNLGRVAARGRRFEQALELLVEALGAFEALGSEALARETEARMAECFVLAGGHQDALELLPRRLRRPRRRRSWAPGSNGCTAMPWPRPAVRRRRGRTCSEASSLPSGSTPTTKSR